MFSQSFKQAIFSLNASVRRLPSALVHLKTATPATRPEFAGHFSWDTWAMWKGLGWCC